MARSASSIKSLRTYSRDNPPDLERLAIYRETKGDSDRAIIIVLGSHVENSVEHILRANLKELDVETEDSLFGPNGPLRAFSAKINMAFALSAFDETMKRDLHTIRELRNAAAHARRPISFRTNEVLSVAQRLSRFEPTRNTKKELRKQFVICAALIAVALSDRATGLLTSREKGKSLQKHAQKS